MPIQNLIPAQQNSLIDTFLQAEQLKNYRSTNALNAAKIAELPYEREREAALNAAKVSQAEAQTGKYQADAQKTNAELALNVAEFVTRDPSNENAVFGALKFGAAHLPGMNDIIAKLEPLRGTQAFAETAGLLAMSGKERAIQVLNERKFTEQQKQSGIDNQFQQGNLNVAQAGLEERRQYHQGMLNKPQAGFSMSYDAEGRPVVTYGTKSEETTLGAERGKARGEAEKNLPKIEDLSAATIRQVDELVAHPGFESAVGATALPYASRVHGTQEADFVNRLDQLKGGAFLQAIEQLKGSGQITEVEGTKATQAVNRMSTATSEGEFRAAAADYKAVITSARDRARAAAAGRPALPPSPGLGNIPAAGAPAEIDFNSLP